MIIKLKTKKTELVGQKHEENIRTMLKDRVSMMNEYAESLVLFVNNGNEESKISYEIRKLELILEFFRNDIYTAENTVIMEIEEEFHMKQKKIFSPSQEIRFIEGSTSSELLHQICGRVIHTDVSYKGDKAMVKVKELSTFTYIDDSNEVFGIYPVSNSEVLINRFYEERLDKVDYTGKVTQELILPLGTSINYFFILGNKGIVYTCFIDKKICRLSSSGLESVIYSTHPLHPTGICKSQDGGMFVCLIECVIQEMTSFTGGEIHHLNTSGRILKKYNYTEKTKQHLFKHPQRICENINTDLCVVDFFEKNARSRLVVISTTSHVRFTYKGQPNLKERFCSYDVCCDKVGRIMVTDNLNHAVHLLREDGHFLQNVLTKQSPLLRPTCVAVHDDTLWVGCEKGVVRNSVQNLSYRDNSSYIFTRLILARYV